MGLKRDVLVASAHQGGQAGPARNYRMPSISANYGVSGTIFSVAGHHPTISQNIMDSFAFDDVHPARARVIEQRRIQQAAEDGHRRARQGDGESVTAHCGEAGAFDCLLWQFLYFPGHAEPFKDRPAIWVDDIAADLVAWKPGVLEQCDLQPPLRTSRGGSRAGRPAADHDHVEFIHDGRQQGSR
jgi:hypothetical protein